MVTPPVSTYWANKVPEIVDASIPISTKILSPLDRGNRNFHFPSHDHGKKSSDFLIAVPLTTLTTPNVHMSTLVNSDTSLKGVSWFVPRIVGSCNSVLHLNRDSFQNCFSKVVKTKSFSCSPSVLDASEFAYLKIDQLEIKDSSLQDLKGTIIISCIVNATQNLAADTQLISDADKRQVSFPKDWLSVFSWHRHLITNDLVQWMTTRSSIVGKEIFELFNEIRDRLWSVFLQLWELVQLLIGL